jgi:hypothetical protein
LGNDGMVVQRSEHHRQTPVKDAECDQSVKGVTGKLTVGKIARGSA